MTHKQRPPKTQAEAPVIMEKQDLCPPCLAIAIDDSKKKGKATQ